LKCRHFAYNFVRSIVSHESLADLDSIDKWPENIRVMVDEDVGASDHRKEPAAADHRHHPHNADHHDQPKSPRTHG
jgi:hypothetical protein